MAAYNKKKNHNRKKSYFKGKKNKQQIWGMLFVSLITDGFGIFIDIVWILTSKKKQCGRNINNMLSFMFICKT